MKIGRGTMCTFASPELSWSSSEGMGLHTECCPNVLSMLYARLMESGADGSSEEESVLIERAISVLYNISGPRCLKEWPLGCCFEWH
jgi:hypothetical protein